MMDGAQFDKSAVNQFVQVKKLRNAVASHPKVKARYNETEDPLYAPFKPDAGS